MSIKRVSKTNLAVFCIIVLSVISVLICCKHSFASEYDNNIGFIKNVPEELKEAFPMCDQFLDVKWIREMPQMNVALDGQNVKMMSWIGTVYVGVIRRQTKDREGLIIHAKQFIGAKIFFLDEAEHVDIALENIIMNAKKIASAGEPDPYFIITSESGKRIVVSRKNADPRFDKRSFSSHTLNICIAAPQRDAVWLIEKKRPFWLASDRTSETQILFKRYSKLFNNYCPILAKNAGVLPSPREACRGIDSKEAQKSYAYEMDTDGDGVIEYVNPTYYDAIVYVNDSNPFVMSWPKQCKSGMNTGYVYGYFDRRWRLQQQCIAEAKKEHFGAVLKEK